MWGDPSYEDLEEVVAGLLNLATWLKDHGDSKPEREEEYDAYMKDPLIKQVCEYLQQPVWMHPLPIEVDSA